MNTKMNHKKEKTPHPYRVPDNFFDDFKTGILETVSKSPEEEQVRTIDLAKKVLLYAAVLVFGFFAVKGIVFTFHGHSETKIQIQSDGEIDAIYSQISDEDLTNFIVNESEEDISKILDF